MRSLPHIKKPFSKTSRVYQIFSSAFTDPRNIYPHYLGPFPRGTAINLAMGLNKCNIQTAHELGLDSSDVKLSAKAREILHYMEPPVQGTAEADWLVEVSESSRYQQQTTPNSYLDALLADINRGKLQPASDLSSSPQPGLVHRAPGVVDTSQDDEFLSIMSKYRKD